MNLLIPAGVRRRKLGPEVMAAYRAPFPTPESRVPTAVFPREILASRDYLAEVEAGLAKLRELPALILWGTKDIAFRAKERERMERYFPHHRTVILEGAGHYIQEDAPEEIVTAVRGWEPVGPVGTMTGGTVTPEGGRCDRLASDSPMPPKPRAYLAS